MKVLKRDLTTMEFKKERITTAIKKASKQTPNCQITEQEINLIADSIEKLNKELSVEEIQDLVVKKLMSSKHKDLAISYQSYRTIKSQIREKEAGINKQIKQLIDLNEDILNENANKDAKTNSVKRDLLAGIASKDYYINKILPKHLGKAHQEGRIHIHDLDYLFSNSTLNCENLDLKTMLHNGCKIGNADMGEPNSIEVAVGHTIQIIASVSSNTYGGCSVPYLDYCLTPYVRKSFIKNLNNGIHYVEQKEEKITFLDKEIYFAEEETWNEYYKEFKLKYPKAFKYAYEMTDKDVEQAMQALEYEINSLSTVNG